MIDGTGKMSIPGKDDKDVEVCSVKGVQTTLVSMKGSCRSEGRCD